jgi:predicted Zn finger-like uncharacterized protein
MYTQCPECRTIFEIDEDALQASLGIVHCGHCSARFDALRTLSNTLPTDPTGALPEREPEEQAPTLTEAVPAAALESAAKKRRKKTSPEPAATAAPETPKPADDWLSGLHTDLTAALLADAAGIPRDAGQASRAWHVDELPGARGDIKHLDEPPVALTPKASDVSPLATDDTAPAVHVSSETVPEPAASESSGLELPPDRVDAPALQTTSLPAEATVPAAAAVAEPAETMSADEEHPASTAEDGTVAALAEPASAETEPANASAETAAMPEAPEHAFAPAVIAAAAPVYVRPLRKRGFRLAALAWPLGCIVLAFTLLVQLGWIERAALFRNAATRAWMTSICASISCRMPPIKDTAKLELLSRDIRPVPDTPGALSITATVRNDATFTQPYPVVEVELDDLDNNPVAMRRFRPAEYMPDPAQRAAGIGPGATVAIAFEVADPGKNAVAFQFNFE